MSEPDILRIIAEGAKRHDSPSAKLKETALTSTPSAATPKTVKPLAAAERRGSSRIATAVDDHVVLNGLRLPLRNWSAAGLLFGPMGTPPHIGQKLELKVTVKCGEDRLKFDAAGEVLRVVNGQVAVRYHCRSLDVAPRITAYFASAQPASADGEKAHG